MKLKEKYFKKIIPELKKEFGYQNNLSVPRVKKVTVNVGLNRGETEHNPKYSDLVVDTIARITGQKPTIKKARRSIAGFKIREGLPVGVSVTLRRKKMYDFIERLINVALPRVRDFRGLEEKNVDQSCNLSIGLKEQTVFPEIDQEKIEKVHGLQVTLTTNATKREEALVLYKLLGFPFRNINN
jgi:large subunit ribosomal protein L5